MRIGNGFRGLLLAGASAAALMAGLSAPEAAAAPCTSVTSAFTNPAGTTIPCLTIATSFTGDVTNAGVITPGGVSLVGGTIYGHMVGTGVINATGGSLGISIDPASRIAGQGNEVSITGPSFVGGISNAGTISATVDPSLQAVVDSSPGDGIEI